MKKRQKILMLKTAKGADEHIHVHLYHEGKEYDVSECLAASFVKSGNATLVEGNKAKQPHENKALTGSDYQNKSDKLNQRRRDR